MLDSHEAEKTGFTTTVLFCELPSEKKQKRNSDIISFIVIISFFLQLYKKKVFRYEYNRSLKNMKHLLENTSLDDLSLKLKNKHIRLCNKMRHLSENIFLKKIKENKKPIIAREPGRQGEG